MLFISSQLFQKSEPANLPIGLMKALVAASLQENNLFVVLYTLNMFSVFSVFFLEHLKSLTNEALCQEDVCGKGCIDLRFLDLATSYSDHVVIIFTPRPLYPRGKTVPTSHFALQFCLAQLGQ
jgi:hypothetical protein